LRLVAHYRNAVAAGSGVALYQLEVLTFSIDHRWMSALGQKQTCAVHKPMSALPLKADMTTTNSRAAYPLPQHMIKMLTVGAFGNDMAADPSLVGLAAASSASSDMSHENGFAAFVTNRVHGSPRLQIVTVSYQVAHPLTFCQAARCAHTDNLSGWQWVRQRDGQALSDVERRG